MFDFLKNKREENSVLKNVSNFDYLEADQYYFDSACQTLRPKQVIDAETEYYLKYNACGERVKYKWGMKVDEKVEECREKLLDYCGKSAKDYAVVFTLNTTYGINLILHQLKAKEFKSIITSETEHNSVFLPSITFSQKNNIPRIVSKRFDDGSLNFQGQDLENSIIILNTVSNIDGRKLKNLDLLEKEVHKSGGVLLLDCAQNFSHSTDNLKKVDFDAAFGSGHKMYGPSIGFIIIKKTLIKRLDNFLIGGGTVYDVEKDNFKLINEDHELHATLELGLQNWAGIIGLNSAIDWLNNFRPEGKSKDEHEEILSKKLFEGLKNIPDLKIFNKEASTSISIYSDKIDAHRLALYLSEQNIMCRSGYFCCHYYLKNLLKLPPLLRISLGLHNKESDIDYLLDILKKIILNS